MRSFLLLLSTLSIFLTAGCQQPTSFQGGPTVPGGRPTCERVCSSYGMTLVGMVSMGEQYTDGCICGVPEAPHTAMSSPTASAAVIGVVMQERAAQQRQQQQQMQMQMHH